MNRLLALALFVLPACTSTAPQTPQATAGEEKPAEAAKDPAAGASEVGELHPALTDPSQATKTAPETFKVEFTTTKGKFVVEAHRDWAPQGTDRFYNLVEIGYYDGVGFFRVIKGFMAQFGIHGNPKVTAAWKDQRIADDPVKQSNKRGYVTFATAGPNTRTTQLFINYGDNANLDGMGFSPFGQVVEGMEIVDQINAEYGEGAPRGMGPNQGGLERMGNDYLRRSFPKLDYIESARVIE